ncbi:TetR/AcrR family transcriptional regulator [Novosphingobium sp. KCTC 2891]|uniref:TetR/AcrR family transcriptional regulator n=1 Tax=Novosphingobium sp. KCTC 2891 TaxID=2989730 RepID=UPI0022230197|nr:TetR/AcrR family transcriptional regulator [Novosphingobium sp. KCTC 2891]MCW1384739.1 TetR/AcrR family transcriptional regulator [Novosphingobium sp. KCTC 2891]
MTGTPAQKDKSPFQTAAQRKATREAKREAVLLAAVRMFNERGFHATSLDDVATSLGVSKPTIYHYLGNKDQVLLECVSIGLSQLQDAAEAARARPGKGIDRLRFFLERYAQVNMEDFGRCVIRTGEQLLSPESAARFREKKRAIDDALRALIEEGIADGSVATQDPRLLGFTLAGALNWPARWFDPTGPLTREEAARRMVDILCTGFAPR